MYTALQYWCGRVFMVILWECRYKNVLVIYKLFIINTPSQRIFVSYIKDRTSTHRAVINTTLQNGQYTFLNLASWKSVPWANAMYVVISSWFLWNTNISWIWRATLWNLNTCFSMVLDMSNVFFVSFWFSRAFLDINEHFWLARACMHPFSRWSMGSSSDQNETFQISGFRENKIILIKLPPPHYLLLSTLDLFVESRVTIG